MEYLLSQVYFFERLTKNTERCLTVFSNNTLIHRWRENSSYVHLQHKAHFKLKVESFHLQAERSDSFRKYLTTCLQ